MLPNLTEYHKIAPYLVKYYRISPNVPVICFIRFVIPDAEIKMSISEKGFNGKHTQAANSLGLL